MPLNFVPADLITRIHTYILKHNDNYAPQKSVRLSVWVTSDYTKSTAVRTYDAVVWKSAPKPIQLCMGEDVHTLHVL